MLRLECRLRPECRRVGDDPAELCIAVLSTAVARHDIEQAIDRFNNALAWNRPEGSHLALRLALIPAPVVGEEPSSSTWHIDLVGPSGPVLVISSQPRLRQANSALTVECHANCAQAYEDVLMTFVLPFLKDGIGLTHLDWVDFMAITAGGAHAKLVVTSLPAPSMAEELIAAHRRRLRETGCGGVTGVFSILSIRSGEGFRSWILARRAINGELPDQAICSDGLHMVADSEDTRIASLLVWGEPHAAPDEPNDKLPVWRRGLRSQI